MDDAYLENQQTIPYPETFGGGCFIRNEENDGFVENRLEVCFCEDSSTQRIVIRITNPNNISKDSIIKCLEDCGYTDCKVYDVSFKRAVSLSHNGIFFENIWENL